MFVLNGQMLLISAPAVLMLDDQLRPEILQPYALDLQTLYFHPSIINNLFTIESMRSVAIRAAHFTGSIMHDFFFIDRFAKAKWHDRVLRLTPATNTNLIAHYTEIMRLAQQQIDRGWLCRTRGHLISLLFLLRTIEPEHGLVQWPIENVAQKTDILRNALQFIQEHYQTDFTLVTLARHCGTNRTTLNIQFCDMTGKTVRAYVIGLRIQMACILLCDASLAINEIMEKVGYQNKSHFARAFQQHTGMSPNTYREKQHWLRSHGALASTPAPGVQIP